jgi:glutathione S-transferase
MAVRRTRVLVIASKNTSSWSLRAWLALKMFKLPFEERVIALSDPGAREALLAVSPSGLAPCLIDGDLTVWDSLAIIEHVADLFPDLNIWPQDRAARSVARSVSAEMHSGFRALRETWPMNFATRGVNVPSTPELQRDVTRIDAIWRDCRARFGNGGPFLFGAFCAADAMFAPVASRFTTYRGLSGDRVVDAYVTALMALKPMQDWGKGAAQEIEAPEAA